MTLRREVLRFVVCAAVVIAVVAAYRHVRAINPTTVALTLLVAVLIVSAGWGLRYAVFLAVFATLALNYYFLPPVGTFRIADTQNWVALLAFLATAVVASQLSERARSEAQHATQRRREIERLYAFSQRLLTTENVPELLNSIPRYVVESFGVTAAALFVVGREDVYRSTPGTRDLSGEQRRAIAARGEPTMNREHELFFTPLRLGVRSVGAIGLSGGLLSRETLEALGTLIAIAIERTAALEKLGKAEASREGEKLRSAILDSVTHEFRTPLTAIKASATSLLSDSNLDPAQRHELITVINEETDRLNHLVGEAAEMAQLDANQVELQREPHDIREAIDRAIEEARQSIANHTIEIDAAERIKDVLLQLLENAGKYSPAGSPIYITAEANGRSLTVSVADRGPGIDDFEQSLIFDKFYRGKNERYRVQGTGMGLAIAKAVVEAHSGTIRVTSQVGHGSVFSFTLPINSPH
ncbi:MAG: sensor histidine kinase [Acidobacteria bacterium]|nr:MAG: sensor histidine kinase [Acidobacteriota bacterium]